MITSDRLSTVVFIQWGLTLFYYFIMVVCILVFWGVLAAMFKPEIAKVGLGHDFGLTYRMVSPDLDPFLEVKEVHPAITDVKITPLIDVEFRPAKRWVILVYGMFLMATLLIGLWIVALLRNFMGSVREGTPFLQINANRIRWVGWLIIVYQIINFSVGVSILWLFRQPLSLARASLQADFLPLIDRLQGSIKIIFVGAIILVIAKVFQVGVRLREEQDLTV
ncbi:MAG TPA: DUF2975 domain-containing protein [Thermoanaerobaculia bacterium]|nr:DUF2975 domain-containing protein [Thermoanaerobaculia bacterium]HUM28538.1 DUF2975 domain-containing protein [Thermoanaerobaculia bacterium]HXK66854.1 DUF2975 domain-containing protein [Thermoanaerobaculia bacterium]